MVNPYTLRPSEPLRGHPKAFDPSSRHATGPQRDSEIFWLAKDLQKAILRMLFPCAAGKLEFLLNARPHLHQSHLALISFVPLRSGETLPFHIFSL